MYMCLYKSYCNGNSNIQRELETKDNDLRTRKTNKNSCAIFASIVLSCMRFVA